MAQFRPAGLSDEDSDSDDYGFYEKPVRNYEPAQQHNFRKKIETNLQDAIINGNVTEVEKILKNDLNYDVNLKLDSGWSPLMHACFHAQEKIVCLLLRCGADPNLHAESITPIMATCSNSGANNDAIFNIVASLIEKGCILNVGDKYGQTPLMRAISSSRVEVVRKLLENDVNIEMRDQQGWTAVFWAAHHNQPEILEILISQGARLTEVDKSGRTPLDIANSHEHETIIEILERQIKTKECVDEATSTDAETNSVSDISTWHDYYPGVQNNQKPNYAWEIPRLLFGMNCERLTSIISKSAMDLRSFLLLDEKAMDELGIDMPYEKQRLLHGLRNFHMRGWKLNAVSGLYARNSDNYSVLDCLTTLGSHLHQTYILEATLTYTLREYKKIQSQLKFEPPDSPVITRMQNVSTNLLTNINSIRREINNMKTVMTKISKSNPQPAGYIKDKKGHHLAIGYLSEVVMFCSIACLVYNFKHVFSRH